MINSSEQLKVTVKFETRDDGGARAWSPDVPGLVLSNADPAKVQADVIPALEAILERRGRQGKVSLSAVDTSEMGARFQRSG